jgi:pimeloyl-ACP methyl ester carboxylesterase
MNVSTELARDRYTSGSVTSNDGTTIGYRQLGHGPGVVVVHGAMESAQSHMQLAEFLASSFTVYLPDRRGRGMSGPYGNDHDIEKDVEDLGAVLTKTGANGVFGVSSGALVCLQAALTLPAIRKAAIFEPPLMVDGSVPATLFKRYDEEIARGNVASALITGMKAAQMGPPIFNLIPRRPLEWLTTMAMASEDKKAKVDDVTMRMLAPTLHYDFQLIVETEGALDEYRNIHSKVLLLGGSKSPAYLKAAVDALAMVLPNVSRVEFPGLGHGATGNSDRGGRPELAAQALSGFFAATETSAAGDSES